MYHVILRCAAAKWLLVLFPVLLIFSTACDRKTDPNRVAQLDVRRAAGIVIDGRLDEASWKRAKSTGAFVSPANGKTASNSRVQASARLLWDAAGLYVAVEVSDANATSPFRREDRDPHIWAKASGIELMLQPGDHGDNRRYYEVQVDVAAAVWDTRFDDYNHPVGAGRFGHQDWSCQCKRSVRRHQQGYAVELMLPWAALASSSERSRVPPQLGDMWRANLYSFRDGQRDALAWSPLLGQGNFHKASRFARLKFVR